MSVVACKSFHADVHAGNLLVLENGKVAFIDFGIVGTISPKTWQAVEGLARGLAEQDYLTMAKAMVQLGATSDDVDIDSFARDLKGLITKVEQLDVDLLVTSQVEGDGVQSVSAQVPPIWSQSIGPKHCALGLGPGTTNLVPINWP
jgi:aarF domain-containing kinase